MRGNTKLKQELKYAKLEHRIAKVNNLALFEENRVSLASYLMDALKKHTPIWGSLKIEFLKAT